MASRCTRVIGFIALLLGAIAVGHWVSGPPASPRLPPPPRRTPTNPFAALVPASRCQLGSDVRFLHHDLAGIIALEPLYWRQSTAVPLTAAAKAQAAQARNGLVLASEALPGYARGVVGDIAALPASQRRWFTGLTTAATHALATEKTFAIDFTTPWAGPGSTPGVTEAVVGRRLATDVAAFQRENTTVMRAAAQVAHANGTSCP